jgi:hypothetical protein
MIKVKNIRKWSNPCGIEYGQIGFVTAEQLKKYEWCLKIVDLPSPSIQPVTVLLDNVLDISALDSAFPELEATETNMANPTDGPLLPASEEKIVAAKPKKSMKSMPKKKTTKKAARRQNGKKSTSSR